MRHISRYTHKRLLARVHASEDSLRKKSPGRLVPSERFSDSGTCSSLSPLRRCLGARAPPHRRREVRRLSPGRRLRGGLRRPLGGRDVSVKPRGRSSRARGFTHRRRVGLDQRREQEHQLHAHAEEEHADGDDRRDGGGVGHVELIELHGGCGRASARGSVRAKDVREGETFLGVSANGYLVRQEWHRENGSSLRSSEKPETRASSTFAAR